MLARSRAPFVVAAIVAAWMSFVNLGEDHEPPPRARL
jgi:hypothetical protein